MSSRLCDILHSTGYRTNLAHARHDGLQNFHVHYRTDSRRTLEKTPGASTKTDEDGDRLTLGTSKRAAPLQLTSQSETQNLTPEPMKGVAVSATPGLVVEPSHLSRP